MFGKNHEVSNVHLIELLQLVIVDVKNSIL